MASDDGTVKGQASKDLPKEEPDLPLRGAELLERMMALQAEQELVHHFLHLSGKAARRRLRRETREVSDTCNRILPELVGHVDQETIDALRNLRADLADRQARDGRLGARGLRDFPGPSTASAVNFTPILRKQRPIGEELSAGEKAALAKVNFLDAQIKGLEKEYKKHGAPSAELGSLERMLKNRLNLLQEELQNAYRMCSGNEALAYHYDKLQGYLDDMARVHRGVSMAGEGAEVGVFRAELRAFPLWRELRRIALGYLNEPKFARDWAQQYLKDLEKLSQQANEVLPELPQMDRDDFELVQRRFDCVLRYQVKQVQRRTKGNRP